MARFTSTPKPRSSGWVTFTPIREAKNSSKASVPGRATAVLPCTPIVVPVGNVSSRPIWPASPRERLACVTFGWVVGERLLPWLAVICADRSGSNLDSSPWTAIRWICGLNRSTISPWSFSRLSRTASMMPTDSGWLAGALAGAAGADDDGAVAARTGAASDGAVAGASGWVVTDAGAGLAPSAWIAPGWVAAPPLGGPM